ncbi:nuclear transport factor 2 family protein [Sphingomonas immobilis]|uniref:Nuclear transport factor 2 family protein n=1 Tax=Sphingomonas immobilis TaxID=3063997 RepID=A0ABT8ZX76_9SPHN|nr:nuclear transport factor 2 family protein [Sphingomonas sp. CA1-15]MDO7842175.1 nuclear transport factor 2 family protein [Sphingomonas sp. CA1-15]
MLSLQEISDRIEIAMLLDRYAGAIDRIDMALLDSVFTPDAAIDYTAFAEWGGIAGSYPEIRAWLAAGLPRSPGFQHIVANKEIALDGDAATGRILCLNPIVLPVADTDGRPRVGFHGLWYLDRYVRTAAGWRIAARTEERCFSHNFPEPAHA